MTTLLAVNQSVPTTTSSKGAKLRRLVEKNSFLYASGFSFAPPHPLLSIIVPSRDASDEGEVILAHHLLANLFSMVYYTLTHLHPHPVTLPVVMSPLEENISVFCSYIAAGRKNISVFYICIADIRFRRAR